jgi:hypothetical protein
MVSAVASEVVTASAEQMPRIWSVTGFCRISGSVRSGSRLGCRAIGQNSLRRMASRSGP